jgi:hypothetical protein
MAILLPALTVAFAALCIWLSVRGVNRQERWAKWMLPLAVGASVLYVASFGPWFKHRTARIVAFPRQLDETPDAVDVKKLNGREKKAALANPKLPLETLQKIPSGRLSEFIWDYYLEHFNMNPEPTLPRGFRIVKSAIIFRSEMDNGGIRQYITNHSATPIDDPQIQKEQDAKALAEVEEDLAALRLIGATESAELLTEALALYQKYGWPFDPEMRWLEFPPEAEAICESIDHRWFHPTGNEPSYSRDWRCGERYLREHLTDCVVE